MDSQSKYNFQDIFNQGSIDTQATELTIKGLNAGAIGINQTGNLVNIDTDQLPEGKTNLYYTDSRVLGVIGGYTFPTVNADTITASTGYITSITGTNGSFEILRCDKLAERASDNIRLNGVYSSQRLVSIPDAHPESIFGNGNPPFIDRAYKDIAIGWSAGGTDRDQKNYNISIGAYAGSNLSLTNNSQRNMLIGYSSGYSMTGSNTVAVGVQALEFGRGNNNVMIGTQSGQYNYTGTGCVFIGHQAGLTENNSNQLIIENSSDNITPLIQGDFQTKEVNIHNTLSVPYLKSTSVFTGSIAYINTVNATQVSSTAIGCATMNATTSITTNNITSSLNDLYIKSDKINLQNSAGTNTRMTIDNSGFTASTGFITRANIVSYTGATGYLSAGLRTQNIQTIGNYFRVADDSNNRIMNLGTAYGDTLGIGNNAGKATSGDRNNWVGYNVGRDTTTAVQNSAMGWSACERITTGNYNNAQGTIALQFNQTGGANTCFGNGAGTSVLNTNNNVIFGNDCYRFGNSSVAGISDNIGLGKEIMANSVSNPTARNVCIGGQVMKGSYGSDNIIIGYGREQNKGLMSNKLVIGNNICDIITGTMAVANAGILTVNNELRCQNITGVNSLTITDGESRGTFNGKDIITTTLFATTAITCSMTGNFNHVVSNSYTGSTGFYSAGIASTNYTGTNMYLSGSFTGSTGSFSNLASTNYTGANMFISGVMTGSTGYFSSGIATPSMTGSNIYLSGRIQPVGQPLCSVYLTASKTNNTLGIIQMSGVNVNIGGHYSTTTYKFTCPVAGIYHIVATSLSESTTTNTTLRVYKNSGGVDTEQFPRGWSAVKSSVQDYANATVTMMVSCLANDTLELRGENAEANYSGMTIMLVG